MRVVVSKKVGGLGSCLVTLFRAWQYALRTGRTLVIDWRASLYQDDPCVNAFDRFFANRSSIAGVPIVTGDGVAEIDYPEPIYPPGWTAERLHRFPDRYYSAAALARIEPERLGSRRLQYELCIGGPDLPHPTVVLHHGLRSPQAAYLGERLFPQVEADAVRRFLGGLEPIAEIRAAAERFAAEWLARGPTVGLHVRHGNGESEERFDRGHSSRLNRSPAALVAAFRLAIAASAKRFGEPAQLFLATDSVEVQERFAAAFPGLVVRPKPLPPAGCGALHAQAGDRGGREALIEMLLLAGCDALVYNDSCFTFLPLFGGAHRWHRRVTLDGDRPQASVVPPAANAPAATSRSTASS